MFVYVWNPVSVYIYRERKRDRCHREELLRSVAAANRATGGNLPCFRAGDAAVRICLYIYVYTYIYIYICKYICIYMYVNLYLSIDR